MQVASLRKNTKGIFGFRLPSTWYIVQFIHVNHRWLDPALLNQISKNGETCLCIATDDVGASYAALWRNGQIVWSVEHFGDLGRNHLDVNGEPPSNLIDLQKKYKSAPGGVTGRQGSFMDIPIDLAENLTGFIANSLVPSIGSDNCDQFTDPTLDARRWWWPFD